MICIIVSGSFSPSCHVCMCRERFGATLPIKLRRMTFRPSLAEIEKDTVDWPLVPGTASFVEFIFFRRDAPVTASASICRNASSFASSMRSAGLS